ncbi:ethanolamine ammonia-lyase light chain EutC [Acinetobacter sp. SFB]|uniref:ethanolamine ammonia-lyase light chain EutC n=1 Tax=Acinetobacter sp. SFB TaxID=1805634 RepID=UPI0024B5703C|nr:ethanolamine ammonia-lyase light chain EutC [Acinetobacter sp. SFB]
MLTNSKQDNRDAKHNCICTVPPAGLSEWLATERCMALMSQSRQLQFSGLQLKNEHEIVVETIIPSQLKHIFNVTRFKPSLHVFTISLCFYT